MKKLITAIFLLFPLACFAEFTDAEKQSASAYPSWEGWTSWALQGMAEVIKTEGHVNRQIKYETIQHVRNAKRQGVEFWGALSSSPTQPVDRYTPTREEELIAARAAWQNMIDGTRAAISSALADPGFAASPAIERLESGLARLESFDWTLAYADPHFHDNPNTPFDESKTIVGPHGSMVRAKAGIRGAHRYVQLTWSYLNQTYGFPTNWPGDVGVESANEKFGRLLHKFAAMSERVATTWAMHNDVMVNKYREMIAADQAASSGLRSAGFFRVLLQYEILMHAAPRKGGIIFSGRNVEPGAVGQFQTQYYADIIKELNKVNSFEEQQGWWDRDKAPGRRAFAWRFMLNFADVWKRIDSWVIAATQFWFPFTPAPPPGGEPAPDPGPQITCGSGTVLNSATNQCEAVPVSCPTLDHRFSITNPDGSIRTYECKLMVSQ